MSQENVLREVKAERMMQDAKWGEQNHHPVEWITILGEEFGEVCKAACEANFEKFYGNKRGNYLEYRKELVQVAAVAVAMIESFDRNEGK